MFIIHTFGTKVTLHRKVNEIYFFPKADNYHLEFSTLSDKSGVFGFVNVEIFYCFLMANECESRYL